MEFVLIDVEDKFSIKGRGLVLIPALQDVEADFIQEFIGEVFIRSSTGDERTFMAKIHSEHFHYTDRPGAWRVVFELPKATKKDFAEGSNLFVTKEVLARIE